MATRQPNRLIESLLLAARPMSKFAAKIQERVNLLEVQEKVKKAAAADMALEALESSEHIKATTFHNERYRH
jgi:hypothetical protein